MSTKTHVNVIENPNSREPITEGEQYFKNMICASEIFIGWTLYEQPIINSMHPDFILTHPEKGILIIEVKDWSLKKPSYKIPAQILGTNNKYFTNNPVDQVVSYKELLLQFELNTFLIATENHSSKAFGMVNTVVYFHRADRKTAYDFCGRPDAKRVLIWDKSTLTKLCENKNLTRDDALYPTCLFYRKSTFADEHQTMQNLVGNLASVLRPSDYARERKKPLILTREQHNLIAIKKGSIRRWGGVAGSGKTLILTTKASEALKSNQRVLILTFNITLRHYIRDLCSQQFGASKRSLLKSHLTISHFHGFLKILMTELGINNHNSGNIEEYTTEAIENINERIMDYHPHHLKYDCILIDEGQDFNSTWILFLKNFFTSEGEFLVMYDEAQSIYENQGLWITSPSEIEGIGFRGRVGHLSISHRLPDSIIHQIKKLNHIFKIENNIESSHTQGDLFTKIQWINIQSCKSRILAIEQKINDILHEGISNIEDITIITMNEKSGIEVIEAFKNKPFGTSHVYDLSGKGDKTRRRKEKWKFQPGKGRLKVCSYQSYKGWESSHIILLLENPTHEFNNLQKIKDVLFIALTRVNTFSDSRSFTCINNCREFNKLSEYF